MSRFRSIYTIIVLTGHSPRAVRDKFKRPSSAIS